jgi:hypothetical protein
VPEELHGVIESQAQILRSQGHEVQIASGGPLEGWAKPGVVLPELDYRTEGTIPVKRLLEQKADLWIIHNPTLGLNIDYPKMIEIAARAGVPMLMQIHDFVEDGRPENYQLVIGNQRLYPNAQHVHYATINRRDLEILKAAGVPESRVHFLPNAVNPPLIKKRTSEDPFVFYPVRGIRRKNLGELCLLAAHAPPKTRFAVALRSGSEEPAFIHDDWVDFAEKEQLPIDFDVVSHDPRSFVDLLERATHLVTTSISEGFGLTFLDPAFLNKPLIGRDLPQITRDFVGYGTLYQSIPVSLDILPSLEKEYREQLTITMLAYGRTMHVSELDHAWSQFSGGGTIDFGNLPENLQRKVISEVTLPELSAWLESALCQPAKQVDISPWTLKSYSENLDKIVKVIGTPGDLGWICPKRILTQFLVPEKFHFLRSRLILPDTPPTND